MSSTAVGSVAVVGGGVVGMAVALELAGSTRECILIDPSPGRGASWAAAGMLSPAAEIAPGEESLVADLQAAAELWGAFADRVQSLSGASIGYERSATVLVGSTSSDVREVARSASVMGELGVEVHPVTATELHAMEPALGTRVSGGWLLPHDHRVDNRLLAVSLLEALKSVGVRIIEDACVALGRGAGRPRLSLAHQGTIEVDACVLATGAASPIEGADGLGLPRVRPVRGMTIRLGPRPGVGLPTRTVRGVVDATHCYVVPREDGSVVIGATSEEQGHVREAPAGGVFRLLEAARALWPGVDELPFDEVAVGLRPATEDHVPFVGGLADPRFIAALGHYRNGILLAPLAARRAAALVCGAA